MSFGENISYFRKKSGLTQDELAEKLELSRQTVSRWENDSSLPDVDTLIKLCDIFGCDMDTLVRGKPYSTDEPKKSESIENIKAEVLNEEETSYLNGQKYGSVLPLEYDKHMNRFALAISLAVGLILFGLATMFMIYAFTDYEALGVAVFLGFVAISVAIFISSGIKHANFKKENPKIAPYPKDEVDRFNKKQPIFISLATAIIIAGVSMIVLSLYDERYYPAFLANVDKWASFIMSIFFVLLSVSIFSIIYSSILKSKYNVEVYNKEVAEETREKTEKEKQEEKIKSLVSSIIMGTATMVFLVLGFTLGIWHPAWIAFPIGGILTGLVNSIITIIRK